MSYVVADTAINTSQLNHIAITNTANTQKIYVNGSEVKSGALIQYIAAESSGKTTIGAYNTTTPNINYQGDIYDVQYYNRVLSSTEVSSIYLSTNPLLGITLRTSNHILENTGVNYTQTVFDSSFSKITNDLTIINQVQTSTLQQKNAPVYADGFNYDGSGIEVPYDASHNEDNFSVSMWIDASSTASYQPLVNSLTSSVVSTSWETDSTQILRASDAGADDRFGLSVAISGNYAIVGAEQEDGANDDLTNSGSAYIFDITSGSGEMKPIARLRASDEDDYYLFGWSVAIHGSSVIVGQRQNGHEGRVLVFDITNASGEMKPIARLRANDRDLYDNFGKSVAISGNYVIAGAQDEDGPGNNVSGSGAAYIFDITNASGEMNPIARLRPSDADEYDNFGLSVAIDGSYAIVGAPFDDGPSNSISGSGSAYIFDITNASGEMKPIARLRASDAGGNDYFGRSVAISGNSVIVSTFYEDGPANSKTSSGAAYVFDITNASGVMKPIARLRPSDAEAEDRFGQSVAISGNYVIVGANQEDGPSNSLTWSGAAYIFDITNASGEMKPIERLRASNAGSDDRFGRSVAISGTNAIVGAHYEDGAGNSISNAGAAYIFNAENVYQTKGYAIGLSDEKVEFRLATDASQSTFEDLSYVVADASINTTQLNHVAITNTANTQKIYVNGTEVKSGALIQYIAAESGSTNIGFLNIASPNIYYQGSIYDVQYYNDVLTSAEITEIYDNVVAVVDSNLTLRTSNHTLANTGVNYVQTVFDASFSKVENTFIKIVASKTVNAVETSSSVYYVQTYSYSNTSYPDLYKSGMVRDICVNEYIASAGQNPHYIQTGNSYTDASYTTSALGTSTYTESTSFSPELDVNVADTYTQTYTISNSDYVDVARTLTRDISVDEWITTVAGQNPHYIQTGNSYTDASYVASVLGTSTYTENVSFSPELNVNVANTYAQTYTISNSDYVDVARTLTRDISVDDFLDLSGESPHYIQTGNSYTDEGIKEPTGIVNGSTSSTLVEKNAPLYADGFNYDEVE